MARTLSDEAIQFIVEQEALLIGLTGRFMRGLVQGMKPEGFRKALIASGLNEQQAEAHISVCAMACTAASRIKAGASRDTVLGETDFPPAVRTVFSRMVDAALAESGEHDLQSFAARPGQIKVEPLHWVLREQEMFGVLALMLLGPALLALVLGVLFWKILILLSLLLAGGFGYLGYRMYDNVRRHFLQAHLAPAKIINFTPRRLATYTNLCNDGSPSEEGDGYAVKVTACDLTEAEFSRIGLGGFVACVCGFGPECKDGQWDDVHPIPVQTATSQSEVLLQSLKRIPQQDWDDFDEALSYLTPEQRSTLGLYRVPAPARVLKAAGIPIPPRPRKTVEPQIDEDLRLM